MLKSKAVKFSITFIILFAVFYYFNIGFFSLTSAPSKHYSAFFAEHLDYISLLRRILLACTAFVLKSFGFAAITNEHDLLVAGRGSIRLVYSCLGLGIMSFFTAFVLAYPKKWQERLVFLTSGLLVIEALNIIRMVVIALFWNRQAQKIIDHHVIFNGIIYAIICIAIYFWITADDKKTHAKN